MEAATLVDRFLDWVALLPTPAVYVVLTLLSAVENVFPPVPADVAVVLGAFLSQRGVTSAPVLGLVCWLANTTSAAGMYYLGRRHAEVFETGWPRRLLPPEARKVVGEAYARHGVLGIFLSRFLPGVRSAVTPFAGVVGMPATSVLVPAATASAIWYAFLVSLGAFLGLNWERARAHLDDLNRVLGVLATAAVVGFFLWLRRRLRAESRPPAP